MKNKIMGKIANLIAIIIPYFVRTVTSFLKYGFIACILLLTFEHLDGYISVRTCCWIIIVSGTIIELIKIIIGALINKFKEEENNEIR